MADLLDELQSLGDVLDLLLAARVVEVVAELAREVVEVELVEQLADQNDASIWVGVAGVSCGAYHTLAHTKGGDAWSWGEVRFGALGIKGETVN